MQLYPRVVKEVQKLPEGPQIGAFFDFDGTVIYGYSATKFLREQIKRGDVKYRQLPEVLGILTKFSLGNIDFSAMMTETAGYLKGIEEKDYIQFGEELYLKHLAKLIYPESRALIEAHLKKGHTVALVSAATPYQVVPAARDLGITHVMCTHMEVEGGEFTGEVIHPTCYGMGKVAAAQKIMRAEGVDAEQSFFYTDSDEDIQLLEFVGNPRPLNPNSRLRSISRGRGWPVQDFNSRGKTGIKDYVRTLAMQGSMVGSALAGVPMYALTGSLRKARNFSISLFADVAGAISGIEIDVEGEEHVWSNRPCVFIFNHQSQADVLIMAQLLRRDMAGVGKKEIANTPILGKIMEYGGTVLIDRENTASALEAMKPLVDVMRNEGRCVCIAPEGTRSTSTNLGRFKKGAFHLAMQAGVPIVPIVIHNAVDVSPRGEYVMRPATVKVTVLPPIDTSEWVGSKMDQYVDYIRDLYLEELDQMVLQRPVLPAESPATSSETIRTAKKNVRSKAPRRRKATSLKRTSLQNRRRKPATKLKVSAQQASQSLPQDGESNKDKRSAAANGASIKKRKTIKQKSAPPKPLNARKPLAKS